MQIVGELKARTTGCLLAYSVRTGTRTHGAVHASSKLVYARNTREAACILPIAPTNIVRLLSVLFSYRCVKRRTVFNCIQCHRNCRYGSQLVCMCICASW